MDGLRSGAMLGQCVSFALRTALLILVLIVAACGGLTTPRDAGADSGVDGGAIDAGFDAAEFLDADFDAATSCTTDSDADGHVSYACGGDDCDDDDSRRYGGNTETCDSAGTDEDCNPATLGPDGDGDGFPSTSCCNAAATGTLSCGGDCADGAATINPTAAESCNLIDDDCDGAVDEGVGPTFYRDADGDNFGDASFPMTDCVQPAGYSAIGTDCDDTPVTGAPVHPGAAEVLNTIDDNCNGVVDESFAVHGTIAPLGGVTSSAFYRVLGGSLTNGRACGTGYCVTGGITP